MLPAVVHEGKRCQEPAKAPVAVEEGTDRLELVMHQSSLDDSVDGFGLVDEPLELR